MKCHKSAIPVCHDMYSALFVSSIRAVTASWQLQFTFLLQFFNAIIFIKKIFFFSELLILSHANDSVVLQIIITRRLEKLQEKIWQAANKQAPRREKNCLSAVQI